MKLFGKLLFAALVITTCFRGLWIPECLDCHAGRLADEEGEEPDDHPCDHCDHLHGSPLGCSHQPVIESDARGATVVSAPTDVVVISPAVMIEPVLAGAVCPDPEPVFRLRDAASCGVLRC